MTTAWSVDDCSAATRTRSTPCTSGDANVLGGTAWLWARPEFAKAVDVLFVDEAGQMSLANVLAVSHAAKSVVLLGDPQQLEQPQKGSHPEGVERVGAPAHPRRATRRFRPIAASSCRSPGGWRRASARSRRSCSTRAGSTSKPGLERQRLIGAGDVRRQRRCGWSRWTTTAIGTASIEEVEVVATLVARLTAPGAHVDRRGRQDRADDRSRTSWSSRRTTRTSAGWRSGWRRTGVRVGTVDKFQGQEAPVVIYSMATSRPEDAPRGMEFLYSLNRLNVATSRARCAAIVVASPRLFEPECRTPRQMKLANALCRYRELAQSRHILDGNDRTD